MNITERPRGERYVHVRFTVVTMLNSKADMMLMELEKLARGSAGLP
jgi:hypothetical protein